MQSSGSAYTVNCTGHVGQRNHTEYVFRVRHRGGCEWTVQRRYQELSDTHDRLCAVFGAGDLPTFPPRTSTASGVVGALFRGPSAGNDPQVVSERERLFQKYFNNLCDRDAVARTPCFQAALALKPPEPVSHLRVRGWMPGLSEGQGLTALLDIRPEGQVPDSSAVAEAYHIVASLVFRDPSSSTEELCPIADFRAPALGTMGHARVELLKPEAMVELKVRASNAMGSSSPVAIRLLVPSVAEAASQGPKPSSPLAAVVAPSGRGADSAAPAEASSTGPLDPDLDRRRRELEREFIERQLEAERLAEAERQRQTEDFRSQREALEREREALERQQAERGGEVASQGACSPASAAVSPSPQRSPRAAEAERDALDRWRGGLARKVASGSALCEDPAMTWPAPFEEEGEGWASLRQRQEELSRQWQELQRVRDEQREEAEKAAEERSRWAEDAASQQAELERRLEEAAATGADRERMEAELLRQRDELKAEAAAATEEAARLAAEADAARAESERRHAAELRLLEEEREAAVARFEEEQRRVREALEQEREELRAHREDLLAKSRTSEAANAERARELKEQQELVASQRSEVEGNRAAEEAERASRLEALRAEQAELERRKEELARDLELDQARQLSQSLQLQEAEAVIRDRAEQLEQAELSLTSERQAIIRSRHNLAVVQAHVVSMLEKGSGQDGQTDKSFNMDDDGEAQDQDAEGSGAAADGVYDMDWGAVNAPSPERPGSEPLDPASPEEGPAATQT